MKLLWTYVNFSLLPLLTSLTLSIFFMCYLILWRSCSGYIRWFCLFWTIFSSWKSVMRPAMALLLIWLTLLPVMQPGRPVLEHVTGHLWRNDLFNASSYAWSSKVATPPFFRPIAPILTSLNAAAFSSEWYKSWFKLNCFENCETLYPLAVLSPWLLVLLLLLWLSLENLFSPSKECTEIS